jgi:NAD(P)-dependent dehydrogenase (short-subunit alcohol dehydrogenase family)
MLTGKVAVVTGASRGIGSATAIALAQAGADVASLHLRDPEYGPSTVASVEAAGRRALFREGATEDGLAVEAFASDVESVLGPIDIWVNNAARLLVRPFLETDWAAWSGLIDSNLNGYRNGCRAALRRMTPRGRGWIINVASVTSVQPAPSLSAYVTAKGGVVAMTKALALEFAPAGIIINAVSPGAIETPLNQEAYTPEVREAYDERIASGRLGQPHEIADAIVFLASDWARYITGHELVVDGGLTINGDVGHAATAREKGAEPK